MDKKYHLKPRIPLVDKLPIIKQTSIYNLTNDSMIKNSRYRIRKPPPKIDINTSLSSLSIKSLKYTVIKTKNTKAYQQKKPLASHFLRVSNSEAKFAKKNLVLAATPINFQSSDTFELSGWDLIVD